MDDRYINRSECINRLLGEISEHEYLYIAFDFDNTVFDFHGVGDKYPKIEELLRRCKREGHKLILFTAMENGSKQLSEAISYCKNNGYEPDYVNESPIMNTIKPYYNILLDDRSGLECSYLILLDAITINSYKKRNENK